MKVLDLYQKGFGVKPTPTEFIGELPELCTLNCQSPADGVTFDTGRARSESLTCCPSSEIKQIHFSFPLRRVQLLLAACALLGRPGCGADVQTVSPGCGADVQTVSSVGRTGPSPAGSSVEQHQGETGDLRETHELTHSQHASHAGQGPGGDGEHLPTLLHSQTGVGGPEIGNVELRKERERVIEQNQFPLHCYLRRSDV